MFSDSYANREALRGPKPGALPCEPAQEAELSPICHSQRKTWFMEQKDLGKETFSFFLPTHRYPWLWEKRSRGQIVTLGPLTPNMSRRINNHTSLPPLYHRAVPRDIQKTAWGKRGSSGKRCCSFKDWVSGL